jgi:hypothetical protein
MPYLRIHKLAYLLASSLSHVLTYLLTYGYLPPYAGTYFLSYLVTDLLTEERATRLITCHVQLPAHCLFHIQLSSNISYYNTY